MDLTTILLLILLLLIILGIIFYFLFRGGRPAQDKPIVVQGPVKKATLSTRLGVTSVSCNGKFSGTLTVKATYNIADPGNPVPVKFNATETGKQNVTVVAKGAEPYELNSQKTSIDITVTGNLKDVCKDGSFSIDLTKIEGAKEVGDVASNTVTVKGIGFTVSRPFEVSQPSAKDFVITFTLKCCSTERNLVCFVSSNTNIKGGVVNFVGNGNLDCKNGGTPAEKTMIVKGVKEDESKQSTVSFSVIDLGGDPKKPNCSLGTVIIEAG